MSSLQAVVMLDFIRERHARRVREAAERRLTSTREAWPGVVDRALATLGDALIAAGSRLKRRQMVYGRE